MADTQAGLRRKLGSAGDLQSVVRAMKAQAAASVGQYERSVAALEDYARSVELGLGACFRRRGPLTAAMPQQPSGNRVVKAVVFGSDQGLVGRFNDIVFDLAHTSLAALSRSTRSTSVWTVGDRVRAALTDSDLRFAGSFAVPNSVQGVTALVARILVEVVAPNDAHEQLATATELHLFYNRPTSGSAYEPVTRRLLPLDDAWRRDMVARPWPTALLPEVVATEGADDTETFRALIREYLFVTIFRACAESLASENASRLASMERADRNIDRMMVGLQNRFQRLRQSSIDEELSDVISGFKSLHQSAVA